MKGILQNINDDVKDIINTNFEFSITDATQVPNDDDPGLTFENGKTKKGKNIDTCVLYIDIRNSTTLSAKHRAETMGKLYTAFIKAMVACADAHSGVVRNIIGDRVMVVFPPNNCVVNAINCAITMHTVASKIINHHFKLNTFKCGIGIAKGEMLVLKTGAPKQGKERAAYKNLVWIGQPANVASKLTDAANKEHIEEYVVYQYRVINPFRPNLVKEARVLAKDFFEKSVCTNGSLYYEGYQVLSYKKETNEINLPPILITNTVAQEYKKIDIDFFNKYWELQNTAVKGCPEGIFGANYHWGIINEIKK